MSGFAPPFSEPRACEGGKSLRLTQTPGIFSPGLVGLSAVKLRWEPQTGSHVLGPTMSARPENLICP